MARRFSGHGEPFDDLLQVAWTRFLRADDRDDPQRGADFPSFPVPTIMGRSSPLPRHRLVNARPPHLEKLQVNTGQGNRRAGRNLGRARRRTG
ncbi:sigma factor [Amycolatopsis sp. NPDC003731]